MGEMRLGRVLGISWTILAVGTILLIPLRAVAQDVVAPDRQASMLARVLASHWDAKAEVTLDIRVAIVHMDAESDAIALADAFSAVGSVGDHTILGDALAFDSGRALLDAARSGTFNAFYVHESALRALTAIQQVTRAEKLPSMGQTADIVERGTSLGTIDVGGHVRLVINHTAIRVEGLAISDAILATAILLGR